MDENNSNMNSIDAVENPDRPKSMYSAVAVFESMEALIAFKNVDKEKYREFLEKRKEDSYLEFPNLRPKEKRRGIRGFFGRHRGMSAVLSIFGSLVIVSLFSLIR